MDHVLVRYSEIGTKSSPVRNRMLNRLRDRISERLDYDGLEHTSVTRIQGRLCFTTPTPTDAAGAISELPGVQSTSPVRKTTAALTDLKRATDAIPVGTSFGIDTDRSGTHSFTSQDVSEVVGAHVEHQTGAAVDLTDPETWIEIDIRDDTAYLFTTRYSGPGGFPVGSQTPVAALVSGGIDSPVAAYEMMTRGCDITPVYFYNKPFAAGDHLLRFEAALEKLVRFHPAKTWSYYCIDMEDVNTTLLSLDHGRMLLHRAAMFRIASGLADRDGLRGIVTGESIGQKSSQTAANLSVTTRSVSTPIFRPLLTTPKDTIVAQARDLGTFEDASINSACQSLAPDHPATDMTSEEFVALEDRIDLQTLIETALASAEKRPLAAASPVSQ